MRQNGALRVQSGGVARMAGRITSRFRHPGDVACRDVDA
jgi:hypothetical protein